MKDINLIPKDYEKKKRIKKEMFTRAALFVTAAILLCVILILPYHVLHTLDSTNKDLDHQIEHLKSSQKDMNTLDKKNSGLKRQRVVIDTLSKNKFAASRLMSEIAECMLDEVSLKSLNINRGKVILCGKATDNGSISSFALRLHGVGGIKDVSIKTSASGGNNLLDFSIEATLRGGETNENQPQG
jgi:Tfp pilus assembly protein PilN